jgi:hypothetical protein
MDSAGNSPGVDPGIKAVLSRDIEAQYHWSGEARLMSRADDFSAVAPSELAADANSIQLVANGPGPRAFDNRLLTRNLAYGKIVPESDYLSAESVDSKAWHADGVLQNGFSINQSGESYRFRVYNLDVFGERPDAAASIHRYVYQGATIPFVTHRTDLPDGSSSYDRLQTTFASRELILRQLGRESDPNRAAVSAITLGPDLTSGQETALWLGACYLTGARVKQLYKDQFDSDGSLIVRNHRLGLDFGIHRAPPFDSPRARPTPDAIGAIFDGFATLIERDFPIEVILNHYFDSVGISLETALLHLFLAIQVSIASVLDSSSEGLLSGTHSDESGAESTSMRKRRDPISSSNRGYSSQLNRCLDVLRISPANDTRWALSLRNELFHKGYIWRRYAELGRSEVQRYYDAEGHLRNLVNAIILRLVDYKGPFSEATRFETLELGPEPIVV